MKIIYSLLVCMTFLFIACGNTVAKEKDQALLQSGTKDSSYLYKKMTQEICTCTSNTMRDKKPSTTLDSCYKAILSQYADSLKAIGYSPETTAGSNKLLNEIRIELCKDLYGLIQKELMERQEKKLLFTGTIVSQSQLPNGEIEIVIMDTKTNEKRNFKSKSFLMDPSIKNKNTLSYEVTIEYEIRYNSKNKKNEYYIKEHADVIGIEVQKVENQK